MPCIRHLIQGDRCMRNKREPHIAFCLTPEGLKVRHRLYFEVVSYRILQTQIFLCSTGDIVPTNVVVVLLFIVRRTLRNTSTHINTVSHERRVYSARTANCSSTARVFAS